MTGAAIEFSVVGASEIEREMLALVNAGEDLTEFNDALGLLFESNTIDRFDRETAPDGVGWKQSLRAKLEGGKTLSKSTSAGLKGSITYESDARSIRVGTNKIYARPHQEGATIRAKDGGKLTFRLPGGLGFRSVDEVVLPARPFLGIGPEDEQDARSLATEFFPGKAPGLFAGGTA